MYKKWHSYNDIKFGLKRKLYEFKHHAKGKTLIYNAQTGNYTGNIDEPRQTFVQEPEYVVSKLELEIFGDKSEEDIRRDLFGDADNWQL